MPDSIAPRTAPGFPGADLTRPVTPLRRAIAERYRMREALAIRELAPLATFDEAANARIRARARKLVDRVRARRRGGLGVDALMREFPLSSPEGLALMTLAEALLRIPDAHTAASLIEERLAGGDWLRHVDPFHPATSAASLGLALAGGLARLESSLPRAIGGAARAATRPVLRRATTVAVGALGSQFVLGRSIDEALARARRDELRGYRHSYDMLGEAALTMRDADRYYRSYVEAIHAIGRSATGRSVHERPGISVKLSALHPRYVVLQRERLARELAPRVKELMLLCKRYDIGLSIDAEEADRLELSLDLVEPLALDPGLIGWDGMGVVVQASQKRCPAVLEWLFDLSARARRRFMVRLVKGAYWDTEVKRAQVEGLADYPVYTRKAHTDIAYLACARLLLSRPDAVFPQFATHNALTLTQVLEMAGGRRDLEFQCLYGMGHALYDEIVGEKGLGAACRIYAPVGNHETLLAYLVRRILENGANASFVNQVVDSTIPVDALLEDPVALARAFDGSPHPAVPLPSDMFPGRRNSRGVDFSDDLALESLGAQLREAAAVSWRASPIVASDCTVPDREALAIRSPADTSVVVGEVVEADLREAEAALRAAQAASDWPQDAGSRRSILLRTADLLESHRGRLAWLAVREAGKTLPNAIGEVREAVDYCRYYATRLEELDPGRPLGTVICISPWNFPLAIFTGQVAAALAAGNRVIAKPAEQTPLIAAEAVRLFHAAGVPKAALQFLPGRGETLGAALVADPRAHGVMFTGSVEAARAIHRTLAARGNVPFVAETGGQNAMLVDSSALPEQVVGDVIACAFDSAGQRCSALRVLLLQNEIADRCIEMLAGAMRELVVGDPVRLTTDVGPIIDDEARRRLEGYIARLERAGKLIARAPRARGARGHFVSPIAFEIDSLEDLGGEVFGPVLHVLRYDVRQLDDWIERLNAMGYGLTFGMHTRLASRIERLSAGVRAGNMYANRNMIGAVVGVQPFGGEGLSGTGPKAGGPLTLAALVRPEEARDDGLRIAPPALARAIDARAGKSRAAGQAGREFVAMLAGHGDPAIGEMARWYSDAVKSLDPRELPGPTGERNRWFTLPRGPIVALGGERGEPTDWLAQALAAIATGNRVLFVASADDAAARDVAQWISRSGGPAIEVRIDCGEQWAAMPEIAAVLCGDAARAAKAAGRVARREGPRIPVIEPALRRWRYPAWRLRVERSISENTTASGGNAALLASVS
jgi:RHH-type proline utilization regulon transcriptional repressor/proline dehydrogenase/delta 1-pyrroline-5-carboxylate dehydrogenase